MKKILHSGDFLDYDGNTIKITFYNEKHLWVSITRLSVPISGGSYIIEVWSDAGDAYISNSEYDWIINPTFLNSYTNIDGQTVKRYRIDVSGRHTMTAPRTGFLYAQVNYTEDMSEYEGAYLNKTITIYQ